VRIGIVIFLTGLVFLGNFAYHHFVAQLGAAGKLALLYLTGGALMASGAWLDRTRETMRNYARVLIAGGAAAIYYTTYAAHFVERLRVIESPIIGGTLLLALAGGIVWLAERRRSETLALLAVLLAYYTSAINAIGAFTLFSSILLTGIAVFFLIRHGWSRLSWASLIGTYGSYAFWRFHGLVAQANSGETRWVPAFLACYWLLFTAAVFIARTPGLRRAERMPFLTANNGAFFALCAHHLATHRPGAFWAFALGFGVFLLLLSALASRRFKEDTLFDGAYLAQGLSLVTIGLAAKLTGYQLGLAFAAESLVLIICSGQRQALLYRLAAGLTAFAAMAVAFIEIERAPTLAVPLGGTVSALLLLDGWWLKRSRGSLPAFRFQWATGGFVALGMALAGFVIWQKTADVLSWRPAWLAAAAFISVTSLPFLRLPEVALFGHGFFATAVLTLLSRNEPASVTWIPVIGVALALEQWWQRQSNFSLRPESRRLAEVACAAAGAVLGLQWLKEVRVANSFLIDASAAALGVFSYALITRAFGTLLLSNLFTLAAVGAFAIATISGHPHWLAALLPAMVLFAMSWGARRFGPIVFPEFDGAMPFTRLAAGYRISAVLLVGGWIFEYVPVPWQSPFFAVAGAVLLIVGGHLRRRPLVMTGGVLSILAMALLCGRLYLGVTLPQLLGILAIPPAARWAARREDAAHSLAWNEQRILVAAALGTVWVWVTRWTLDHMNASNLTVSWSLLALIVFVGGFALRERIYRLGGLVILGLAVGRIFLVDVWQLETIYRILSFLVLGAVLLLLGFAYNRFAESLRRWL
jgi:hypothetical protein